MVKNPFVQKNVPFSQSCSFWVLFLPYRKRYSNLAKRLYVTGDASYHELIILPYGDINELMSVEIKGQDITGEIDMAVRTLDSLSRFHPWSRNKRRANVSQKPTVTDASKLATIEKKVQHSVIAIFCKIGA